MIDGLQRERICSRTTECGRQGQVLAVPSSALECPSGKPKTHKSSQVSLLRARAGAAPLCAAHTPCASPPCIAAHTGQQSYKTHAHPTAGGHRPHGQQKGKTAKKKDMQKNWDEPPAHQAPAPRGLPSSTTTVTSARPRRFRWESRRAGAIGDQQESGPRRQKSSPPRPLAGSKPQGSLFARRVPTRAQLVRAPTKEPCESRALRGRGCRRHANATDS